MRRDNLEQIVNVAVNQTLGRTVITAGTAFLSTLALYLFGGEVLKGLAFTMIVGIISGTYSTRVHRRRDRDHVAGAQARRQAPPAARRRASRPAPRSSAGRLATPGAHRRASPQFGPRRRPRRPSDRARPSPVSRAVRDTARRRAAGRHSGTDGVPAGLVDRPPADRRAPARLSGSRRRLHGDDPARIDSRRDVAVPGQDRPRSWRGCRRIPTRGGLRR